MGGYEGSGGGDVYGVVGRRELSVHALGEIELRVDVIEIGETSGVSGSGEVSIHGDKAYGSEYGEYGYYYYEFDEGKTLRVFRCFRNYWRERRLVGWHMCGGLWGI